MQPSLVAWHAQSTLGPHKDRTNATCAQVVLRLKLTQAQLLVPSAHMVKTSTMDGQVQILISDALLALSTSTNHSLDNKPAFLAQVV